MKDNIKDIFIKHETGIDEHGFEFSIKEDDYDTVIDEIVKLFSLPDIIVSELKPKK